MLVSSAASIVPETAPADAADRRPYVLADRSGAAVRHAAVAVDAAADVELTASLPTRTKVFIKSVGGNPDIYIGSSGVTAATGYLIRAKEEIWLELTPNAPIHARAAGGTADVRVLETGP